MPRQKPKSITEGNKVSAQIRFGFSVNGYGVGDLAKHINEIPDNAVNYLVKEYESTYMETTWRFR